MNQQALVTLCVLLGVAHGKSPEALLSQAHGKLRALQAKEPAAATVKVVLTSALLFYAAERGKNPKIRSLYDALVYVSTNISVGHSDIQARTPLGKMIGSALMTYGPSLAARALDPPSNEAEPAASDATLRELGLKLDAILEELARQRLERADREPSSLVTS